MHRMDQVHPLKEHLDQLMCFARVLSKCSRVIVLAYTVLALFLTLTIHVHGWRAITDPSTTFTTASEAATYSELVTLVKIYQWLNVVSVLAIAFAWPFASYAVFILTGLSVDLAVRPLFPEPSAFARSSGRYTRLFRSTVGRRSWIVFAPFLFLMLYSIADELDVTDPVNVVDTLVSSALMFAPVVFLAHWSQLLAIRHGRTRKEHLDNYLFSRLALLRNFKGALVGVAFFAIFGWVLIPSLLLSNESLSRWGKRALLEKHEYAKKWVIVAKPTSTEMDSPAQPAILPSPVDLEVGLSALGAVGLPSNARIGLPRLQKGLFLIATVVTFLGVGIPAGAGYWIHEGLRRVLKASAIATLKAALLVAALQVFIRNAFFLDPGETIGLGAMFMLVLSFFLALRGESGKA